MRLLALLILLGVFATTEACARDVMDSGKRVVTLPDHAQHVLPANQEAAILLAVLAPEIMVGWPVPVSEDAKRFLPPRLRNLPTSIDLEANDAGLTGADILPADLIVDYAAPDQSRVERADRLQRQLGIPVLLLDQNLADSPFALRLLGVALGLEDRAEALARLAENILTPRSTVGSRTIAAYGMGEDGLFLPARNSLWTEALDRANLSVVPMPRRDVITHFSFDELANLDPSIIVLSDPRLADDVRTSPGWRSTRAWQQHQIFIDPALPFGWVGAPYSINRLAGVAWLKYQFVFGQDSFKLVAAFFNPAFWGYSLDDGQLQLLVDRAFPFTDQFIHRQTRDMLERLLRKDRAQ